MLPDCGAPHSPTVRPLPASLWLRARPYAGDTDPAPIEGRTGALAGKAYVTDGDGIRVSGQEVRFAGLDAPEWNRVAKQVDGYWFGHGRTREERTHSEDRRQAGARYSRAP